MHSDLIVFLRSVSHVEAIRGLPATFSYTGVIFCFVIDDLSELDLATLAHWSALPSVVKQTARETSQSWMTVL